MVYKRGGLNRGLESLLPDIMGRANEEEPVETKTKLNSSKKSSATTVSVNVKKTKKKVAGTTEKTKRKSKVKDKAKLKTQNKTKSKNKSNTKVKSVEKIETIVPKKRMSLKEKIQAMAKAKKENGGKLYNELKSKTQPKANNNIKKVTKNIEEAKTKTKSKKDLSKISEKIIKNTIAISTSHETLDEITSNLAYWNLENLEPSRFQPRREIIESDLESLAESIKAQGVLQPIVIRKTSGGMAEIIAGERRWRASKLAGLTEIPAIEKDIPDEACMAIGLIENIQRENLNPVETALALERLVNEFDLTHARIAKVIGKSRTSITNSLRLLTLPKEVKIYLERGDIEVGHAKVLLGLPSISQAPTARTVIAKGLSVRETEQLVTKMLNDSNKDGGKKSTHLDPDIKRLQTSLRDTIGAKVKISHNRRGRGKIVISYNSLDELDGILEHIN